MMVFGEVTTSEGTTGEAATSAGTAGLWKWGFSEFIFEAKPGGCAWTSGIDGFEGGRVFPAGDL